MRERDREDRGRKERSNEYEVRLRVHSYCAASPKFVVVCLGLVSKQVVGRVLRKISNALDALSWKFCSYLKAARVSG